MEPVAPWNVPHHLYQSPAYAYNPSDTNDMNRALKAAREAAQSWIDANRDKRHEGRDLKEYDLVVRIKPKNTYAEGQAYNNRLLTAAYMGEVIGFKKRVQKAPLPPGMLAAVPPKIICNPPKIEGVVLDSGARIRS